MTKTILAIILATTALTAPALARNASAAPSGSSCASSAALGNAIATAGAISSLWSGGRATAALQVAQQIQLVAQRICQQEQLLAQLRMLAGMDLRTVEDVLWALSSFDRILRGSGLDLSVGELMRALGDAYPAVFGEETFGAMEDQAIIWNERTRDALDRKSRIENMVIGEQRRSLQRAGQPDR